MGTDRIPVLLIAFNRPSHTRRVLETIVSAKLEAVYVFQDGARSGNDTDYAKCEEVRKVITEVLDDSGIALKTYYSDHNLGCGAGPMTGIKWFFSQVEMGIVMEDDCLPHPDFFGYCEELLWRFKNNESIRFINATLYNDRWKCDASYDFSRYMVTGAWAGWKRTFDGFDLDLHSLNALDFRRQVLKLTGNRAEATWWYSIVCEIQRDPNKKTYWDYQMQILLFKSNALTIHPASNLISNIGFDLEGTHTIDNVSQMGERPVFPILPLQHPDEQVVNRERDSFCWAKARSKGWLRDEISFLYQRLLWSKGLGHWILMAYKRVKGKGFNSGKVS